jgi:hypothetical protein
VAPIAEVGDVRRTAALISASSLTLSACASELVPFAVSDLSDERIVIVLTCGRDLTAEIVETDDEVRVDELEGGRRR